MFAAAGGRMPPETLAAYRQMLGFVDALLWQQYLTYLRSVLTLDLGPSIMLFPTPVTTVLAGTLPWTVFLAGTATLLSIFIGCFIGLYAAFNRGGFVDRVMPVTWQFLASMPQAVTALAMFFIFAFTLSWFPLGFGFDPNIRPGWTPGFLGNVLYHAALPLVTLLIPMIATWVFTMRNATVNVLGKDYIAMARAKGLAPGRIMRRYAARNAILPVVTAVAARDYLLMQACFLLIANFIADMPYVWLDPRLRG